MKEQEKELYKKREEAQALLEDNQLAIIEFTTKVEMLDWLQKYVDNLDVISGDVDPSKVLCYLEKKLGQRSLFQVKLVRERCKRRQLISRVVQLWQD